MPIEICRNYCIYLILISEDHHNISEPVACKVSNVMGSLVTNASPFLFPCTIEYSLICAVILLEMWKKVKTIQTKKNQEKKETRETRVVFVSQQEKVTNVYNFRKFPNILCISRM